MASSPIPPTQKLRKTYNVAEIELASAEKNKEKVGMRFHFDVI